MELCPVSPPASQVSPIEDTDAYSHPPFGDKGKADIHAVPSRTETENVTESATRRLFPSPGSSIFTRSNNRESETQGNIHRNTSELAPVDGGFGAWSFLASAFIVENITWGFPSAFGVFLDAYLKDATYMSQPNAQMLLPLIGTLTSGIMYCSGPFTYPLIYRYPNHARASMWIGALVCWASLFAASYTTNVVALVLCQGVLYAVGGTLLYNPCVYYMTEWFVARRGLANGVISAGSSTGGLALPLILPTLFDKYGASATLRILSVAFFAVTVLILPFLRGRLPIAKVRGPAIRSSSNYVGWDWIRRPGLQLLLVANTLQGFGYFVPILWLPTFATDLNLNVATSSLTLALLNGTTVVGSLVFGFLADYLDPWLVGLFTLIGTCFCTFVLWGVLSYSFGGLVAFGLSYGSLAGGWSSLWTGFMRDLSGEDPRVVTTVIGYLMLSRGVGNILSTPISTALSNPSANPSSQATLGFNVGGGRFSNIITFAGTCFAGAALTTGIGWGVDSISLRQRRRS